MSQLRSSLSFAFSLSLSLSAAVAGCGSSSATPGPGGVGGQPGGSPLGSGAGGASCDPTTSVMSAALGCSDPDPGALDYLDDMEDGDYLILMRNGRNGVWYTYHDTTPDGMLDPAQGTTPVMAAITGRRCGTSTKAMRVTGSGWKDWGAGFGFNFRSVLGADGQYHAGPYDGTAAHGITFWARTGEISIPDIRASVADQWSSQDGGHCDPTVSIGDTACYDHFGTRVTLTSTWQRYTYNFGQLEQRSFGIPRPALDTTALYTIQFDVNGADVFDIWIDDVAFF